MFVEDEDTRYWESVLDDAWSWRKSVRAMRWESRYRYEITDPRWSTARDELDRALAVLDAKASFAEFRLELARVGLTVADMWAVLPDL